jgi:hypothetical protein
MSWHDICRAHYGHALTAYRSALLRADISSSRRKRDQAARRDARSCSTMPPSGSVGFYVEGRHE